MESKKLTDADLQKMGEEINRTGTNQNKASLIWQNTKNGAKVYVGGWSIAKDLDGLKSLELKNIVNCQQMQSENFFENYDYFEYVRFPVGSILTKSPFKMTEAAGHLKFWYPMIEFVERKTDDGENVLIHCAAGAHRAGATGTAWLMYAENLTAQ